MLTLSQDIKIYIYTAKVDMRKAIDGLAYIVINEMQLDPQSKSLFIFTGRSSNKIKALFWDHNGFVLLYKRLERDRFIFPKNIEGEYYTIESNLLKLLLRGFDFYKLIEHDDLNPINYF